MFTQVIHCLLAFGVADTIVLVTGIDWGHRRCHSTNNSEAISGRVIRISCLYCSTVVAAVSGNEFLVPVPQHVRIHVVEGLAV